MVFTLPLLSQANNPTQEDWQCVYPNKKVYFENRDKIVYCVRIDSTSNGGSVLYPFSDLHEVDAGCYSINSGSWLSKHIILNEDGNTVFVNGRNQQILIKNQAELNEIWDVFENESIKVKGEITSVSLESVLGVEDSVKTIRFSVYNLNNEPVNHDLNQLSVEVSKHFGLVKTVNFYYFENKTFGDTPYQSEFYHFGEFNLIGINEPQLGFQNINLVEQYYDSQVGDELHYSWDYYFWDSGAQITHRYICKYLSRSDYEDRIEHQYELRANGGIPTVGKQTIPKGKLLFETEPNEPFFDDSGYSYGRIRKAIITNRNTFIAEMFVISYLVEFWQQPLCFFQGPAGTWGRLSSHHYYSGLSGPYPGEYYDIIEGIKIYKLVYYKKGDIEYGTPFDFDTSVSDHKNDNSFSVYPNPANDYITIKSANNESLDNCIVEIYDLYGRKLLTKSFDNTELLDVSFLNSGYYMIKLIPKNKNITYIKMIKH